MTQIDGKVVERWKTDLAWGRMARDDQKGDWVRASDYDAILSERDALQAQVDGLTKERDMYQDFFRSCLNGNHALKEKTQQAVQERDAALAHEGAVAMEVRERAAEYIAGFVQSGVNCNFLGMADTIYAIEIPTDAAAALARREDEVIEECAVHIETVWSNEIADDLRRALKRSGKETK